MRLALELAEQDPRYFMPFQYANPANPRAHYEGTGTEIAEALPATTSWWRAPAAPVPVSIRERGDRNPRGRVVRVADQVREDRHQPVSSGASPKSHSRNAISFDRGGDTPVTGTSAPRHPAT